MFARARENARRTSCLSNLKQIGLGAMMYVQDYDEMYPLLSYVGTDLVVPPAGGPATNNNWIFRLQPYLKSSQLFNCPSATRAWDGSANAAGLTSYGANQYFLAPSTAVSMASVESPSQLIMFADSDGEVPYTILIDYYGAAGSSRWVADRHLEGTNIAFADGHAKWKKMSRDSSNHPVPPKAAQGVYWYADGHA